jgi:3-phenylpropionate/trans-cinnamate dioxygenase ferredoxin reductase component
VLLVGSEPERPYERPPLTKDYLRGESEREKTYVHEHGVYEAHQIELETDTTVTAIDSAGPRVTLAGGRELSCDRLLLATGAGPRRTRVGLGTVGRTKQSSAPPPACACSTPGAAVPLSSSA